MQEPEILASSERSIGLLYLSRYPEETHPDGWVYTVHIDGELLMSSVSPLSERMLATYAIEAHKGTGKLKILVGGLGLGHTAEAALASPRTSLVRVIDRMDFVIGWIRDGRLPLSELLNGDERVELVLGDVYADLLGRPTEKWDIILVDVDHSPEMPLDPASADFYTVEGQQRVAQHLAPGGVMGVWSAHDNPPFAAVMAEAYPESRRQYVEWDVPSEHQTLHNVLFFGRLAL